MTALKDAQEQTIPETQLLPFPPKTGPPQRDSRGPAAAPRPGEARADAPTHSRPRAWPAPAPRRCGPRPGKGRALPLLRLRAGAAVGGAHLGRYGRGGRRTPEAGEGQVHTLPLGEHRFVRTRS